MNKAELITAVSEKTNLTKKDTEITLGAILETITGSLKSGEKVQLVGFGTFDVKNRRERIGTNPQTKENIVIPASRAPQFKAGKAFKEAVAK